MGPGKEEPLWQLSYLEGEPRGAEKCVQKSLPGPTLTNELPCSGNMQWAGQPRSYI